MDFFEQLSHGGVRSLAYPGVHKATGLKAALFRNYLKMFNGKLATFKPLALVNEMPVYDLTQAPLYSEANQRVLEMGANYKLLGRPAKPISAVIAITHACDCACSHCSARDYMQRGIKAMSYEQLIDLIDQALEMGAASIVLTGGETTLHPRLVDVVDHIPKNLAAVSMFTNGAKLDRAMAGELRSAGLNAALVSLDAPSAELHDKYRQREGSYDQAIKAIEALHEVGSLVGISSYISHEGFEDGLIDSMLQKATELKAHQLFLFDAVPSGAMRQEKVRHFLSPEDRLAIKQRTMEFNATPGGPGIMGQSWINSPDGFGCFAGFYQCYVSASGDVTPCDFTPISFGNVTRERLEIIWQRMRDSTEWQQRSQHCRMQDDCFRASSVDLIPADEPLPISYQRLLELREQANISSGDDCSCQNVEQTSTH